MLTGTGYRASLVDGRRVHRAGRLVEDVCAEPFFEFTVAEVARGTAGRGTRGDTAR